MMWVEKLRPVHFNAHFHLCCIMLYLEISQIHLNPQQSIMSVPKNTPLMSKTKWRQLESFSQKSNKITNVQQLVSFCKVYSPSQSIISIKVFVQNMPKNLQNHASSSVFQLFLS
eukprot:TCONS_00039295-protein